jgi:hypothetical protein
MLIATIGCDARLRGGGCKVDQSPTTGLDKIWYRIEKRANSGWGPVEAQSTFALRLQVLCGDAKESSVRNTRY